MASDTEELNVIVQDLKHRRTAKPVTVRDFLSWFGARRRSSANVDYINKQLEKLGIRTVPNYLNIWVDTPITFELIEDHPEPNSSTIHEVAHLSQEDDSLHEPQDGDSGDPSYRIGRIASANTPPISVKPNASLLEATTLMHFRNYSQLPVMTTDREVKGVISWESIGARSVMTGIGNDVQSFMDDHHEVPVSASLFVAIRTIVEHNYVLIRAPDRKISGIVTASDIALHFEDISTPFLLIAEIENSVRLLISGKISVADVKKTCNPEFLPSNFSKISDLTFGNYVKILDHPENWAKLGLRLDRVTFCTELSEINQIRNDVVHFDPDPLTKRSLVSLRNVSKLLNLLRGINAF